MDGQKPQTKQDFEKLSDMTLLVVNEMIPGIERANMSLHFKLVHVIRGQISPEAAEDLKMKKTELLKKIAELNDFVEKIDV